ncbi:MAG: flagella basal body P-ring formation protein FlgA [Magnetovibrio sp.]|nr:flagella basal body P-ring formation protein FlgA [Magnetovibrio sp.]|tara:strand:+ start:204 stop:1196 length:993 start_codon:yes stop_codon:yes gene_type:complete
MRNILIIVIIIWATTCVSKATEATANPPIQDGFEVGGKVTLIKNVEVTEHLIRLGDLFTNTGNKEQIEVAYAPEPGERVSFDARWLYRTARAHKLPWRPLSNRITTVVTRQSHVIERQEIKEIVLSALIERGANPSSEIVLTNKIHRFHIPNGTHDYVNIHEIYYNKRSQRFSGSMVIPTGNGSNKLARVSGRLFLTQEVPVLNRRIMAGQIIKTQDITWVKVRASRLQSNVIMSEIDLIQHTPKRALRAGYPIRISAVQRPVLVPKNSLVTIVLHTSKMFLTSTGKALENGSDGDVIKIANSQSKAIIEAEVIAAGRVSVRPSTQLAIN